MPQKIVIASDTLRVNAELNDTDTAQAIIAALPIAASANTWGDEIYFGIPVEADLEDGREVVDMSDLGYWPPGRAFCIFFGRTPASRGDEIQPGQRSYRYRQGCRRRHRVQAGQRRRCHYHRIG